MQDLKNELLKKEINLVLSDDELSRWGDVLETEEEIVAKILKVHSRYYYREYSFGTFFGNSIQAAWISVIVAFFLSALTITIGEIPALIAGALACAFVIKVMQSTSYLFSNFLVDRQLKKKERDNDTRRDNSKDDERTDRRR